MKKLIKYNNICLNIYDTCSNKLFWFLKMVKIIAVCGNIGAGKSTFIKNYPKEHPTENVV